MLVDSPSRMEDETLVERVFEGYEFKAGRAYSRSRVVAVCLRRSVCLRGRKHGSSSRCKKRLVSVSFSERAQNVIVLVPSVLVLTRLVSLNKTGNG